MNQALATTRTAADGHDKEKALAALSSLSGMVNRESRAGQLPAADERALRTGIAQARRRVELDVTAAPPPEPTAPAAQPPTPAPQGTVVKPTPAPQGGTGKGHGKDKVKGKGHG